MNVIRFCLLLICLNFLISCGQVKVNNSFKERLSNNVFVDTSSTKLTEVATPFIIKQLNQDLEKYTPHLKIIAPQAEQVLSQTDVSVKLKVKDLPIFQDQKLKLGNHLDLILDNEVSQSIYDLDQPIVLKNLSPGTHSLRAFAARPWGESFKNDGAYAQVTFSVLTETNDNRPDSDIPLLTYSRPTGTYGAEPFLLDFYLTNAPLHAVAKSNSQLKDWLVKATVNGDSFLIENWQPVYLTGFNQGENWIQLELIDEKGNNIENTFNNTVRVINYDPTYTDTIGQLFTDEISLADAQSLIEQNYSAQPLAIPKSIEPQVKLDREPEMENIIDSSPVSDISQPKSPDPLEAEIEQGERQNNISEVISEDNPEVSSANTAIANPEQTQVNPTEENKQSLLPEQVKSATKTENVPKSTASSSSETRVINPTVVENSDIKVSEINQRVLENKQLETDPAKSTESEQIIPIEKKNTDTSEPVVKITIPQSESTEFKEAEITIDSSSIDPELEQVEETSTVAWWKKILVGLRQKLESLLKLLPNEV